MSASVKAALEPAAIQRCHWPYCQKIVPSRVLCCGTHWLLVPIELRSAVMTLYKPRTLNPSAEYIEAVKVVDEWIWSNANPPEPEGKR